MSCRVRKRALDIRPGRSTLAHQSRRRKRGRRLCGRGERSALQRRRGSGKCQVGLTIEAAPAVQVELAEREKVALVILAVDATRAVTGHAASLAVRSEVAFAARPDAAVPVLWQHERLAMPGRSRPAAEACVRSQVLGPLIRNCGRAETLVSPRSPRRRPLVVCCSLRAGHSVSAQLLMISNWR